MEAVQRCCGGELPGALTDVALFALFGFVAQADFKPVDFTGQVAERTGERRRRRRWSGWSAAGVKD